MPPVIANTPPVFLTLTSTRRTGWWLWGCALSVVGAGMLFFFDPAQHGFYPRCLFHSATGLHCPGCGVLRGLHRLLHGHPLEAFRMNPLAFTLLPTMAGVCLWRPSRSRFGFCEMSRSTPSACWRRRPEASYYFVVAFTWEESSITSCQSLLLPKSKPRCVQPRIGKGRARPSHALMSSKISSSR